MAFRAAPGPQVADGEAGSGCEEDQIVVGEIAKPNAHESESSLLFFRHCTTPFLGTLITEMLVKTERTNARVD
jgi:hypothetical protein